MSWTPEQLGAFLRVAFQDRYSGMWVLAATTGMRRSELAGVERAMIDFDNGTLTIEDTRVVVAGKDAQRAYRPRRRISHGEDLHPQVAGYRPPYGTGDGRADRARGCDL
jgi:integrase